MSQHSGVNLYWVRSHPLVMVLGMISALFAVILMMEWLFLGGMPDITVQPRSSVQSFELLSDNGIKQPKRKFKATVERPMFYQDRQPINQVVVRSGALSDWVLTGVVITSSKRFALLENERRVTRKEKNARLRLKVKEYIDGTDWSVMSIEREQVTFKRGGQIESLKLLEKQQSVKKDRHARRK